MAVQSGGPGQAPGAVQGGGVAAGRAGLAQASAGRSPGLVAGVHGVCRGGQVGKNPITTLWYNRGLDLNTPVPLNTSALDLFQFLE